MAPRFLATKHFPYFHSHRSQLYGNRAQAYLSLRNFSSCVSDCKRCLKEDPKNIKAFFRAARSSVLNGLYQQAIDFCDDGLKVQVFGIRICH